MRCDLPVYVFASVVSFCAAGTFAIRSFMHSELWFSVKDCHDPQQINLDFIRDSDHWSLASTSYGQSFACSSMRISALLNFIASQKISLLIHINMAICCFLVLGKALIGVFFGSLLPIESQHLYNRMLNFVLFKVVFVAVVLEPVWAQVLQLSIWIAILGFLRLFSLLSRDRFDHLASMAYIPVADYSKIVLLLSGIFACSMLWLMGSFFLFPMSVSFLTLEFLPMAVDTMRVMTKYVSQLIYQRYKRDVEDRQVTNYYTELGTDMLMLGLTFLQYLQLMWIHGISFGLVDIVLFVNTKNALKALYRKASIHIDKWCTMSVVQNGCMDVTSSELLKGSDGDCPICRETMTKAKKLLCGHVFHLHCLHAWIHHHESTPTCPTCRRPLSPRSKQSTGH